MAQISTLATTKNNGQGLSRVRNYGEEEITIKVSNCLLVATPFNIFDGKFPDKPSKIKFN